MQNKSYEEWKRRDSFGTKGRRMNCFIRRIAAEEEAADRKVAESRSEMRTDMIGNGRDVL